MTAVHGLTSLLREARQSLAEGLKVQIVGAASGLTQLAAMAFLDSDAEPVWSKIIVIVPSAKDFGAWLHLFEHNLPALGLSGRGAILPSFAAYGNDRFINPVLTRRQRIHALSQLLSPHPSITVTTLTGLAQKTLHPDLFQSVALSLAVDEEHDQDNLAAQLKDLGYIETSSVEEEGTFAIRGGILDVYPLNCEDPLRCEFLGDTLTSIRTFSSSDQRSRAELASAWISPAFEAFTPRKERREDAQKLYNVLLEHNVKAMDRDGILAAFQELGRFSGFDMFAPVFRHHEGSGFDYLSDKTLLIFPGTTASCIESFSEFYQDAYAAFSQDIERERASLPPDRHFLAPEKIDECLSGLRQVEFGNPFIKPGATLLRLEGRIVIEGMPQPTSSGTELFDKWIDVLERTLKNNSASVAVLTHSEEQKERLQSLLFHRGLKAKEQPQLLQDVCRGRLPPGQLYIGHGELSGSVWLEDSDLLLVPEHMFFGPKQRRAKPASARLQNYLSSFKDLKVDDLVVHVHHGIGRYRGMTTLMVGGAQGDFLIIEYAGGDKIYLPVDRLNLLQRYSASGEGVSVHALDKLGGTNWEKRKSRIKAAVQDMAESLLKTQAQRVLVSGAAYGPTDDAYLKFEAEFPYEETEDQLRSLDEISRDFVSGKPMDRLICGDVGFGKTEIALRATLRTVLEGHQVLVLVPTTVLCYQHYRTFRARLEHHGVSVAQVNRFVTASEARAVTEGLAGGRIDVVIGTHRLLSKDIKPKRIGLLVVDEEQRFGVAHKEKLKSLRMGAHVLTMTATPIPRTLHMAMLGLRDISIITTPPQNRLSVKTYVAKFDEALIKDAIEQEVARGGQVFFVHNRVEDIEEMRLFLKKIMPRIDVRVAHGKMREHQLEKVIVDFLEQKFPVLLCTTIIESGIDMPNVNTLIVDRADRFGLAQLYQLRGRVGRASVQAYAYFLTPPQEHLSEESQKRLEVLAAHQELGAGFQIASHDLELRGAGNLLGADQSGQASEVGLELYTEMLEGAIANLRGQEVRESTDAEIKLSVSALIPETYVKSENQRLYLYKSLFSIDSSEDLARLRQEMEDRFGRMPEPCSLLFRVAWLKQILRRCGATRLAAAGRQIYEVRFGSLSEKQIADLIDKTKQHPDRYQLSPDYRLLLFLPLTNTNELGDFAIQEQLLRVLISLLEPLVI